MRGVIATTVVLLGVLLGSCGGGGGGGMVKLTILTPVAEPTVAENLATPVPPPELILSTENVYQAGAILVSLTGEISGGTLTALGRSYPLSKGARSYYTFLPIDAGDPPGGHTMFIEFTTTNGSKGNLSQPFTVIATSWTQDYLTFTPDQVNRLLDPAVESAELEQLRRLYQQVTPQKFWDGPWLLPIDAPVTGMMGEQRSINGGPMSGHHSGTDFGAETGTPVGATNTGKVVLARQMVVRGNMVVIDHGGGLYSGYAHLSSLAVAEGQIVAPGDIIGYVGSTGRSTGAHLHWEMSQGGIWLDPLRFADGSNGF